MRKVLIPFCILIMCSIFLYSCTHAITSRKITKLPEKTKYIQYADTGIDYSGSEMEFRFEKSFLDYAPPTFNSFGYDDVFGVATNVNFNEPGKYTVTLNLDETKYDIEVIPIEQSNLDAKLQEKIITAMKSATQEDYTNVKDIVRQYLTLLNKANLISSTEEADEQIAYAQTMIDPNSPIFKSISNEIYYSYSWTGQYKFVNEDKLRNSEFHFEYIYFNGDTAEVGVTNKSILTLEDTVEVDDKKMKRYNRSLMYPRRIGLNRIDGKWVISSDEYSTNSVSDIWDQAVSSN